MALALPVAAQVLDECTANAATCNAAGQTCTDPNTAAASTGDWQCVCQPPQTGTQTGGVATCTLNECLANGMPLSPTWVPNEATCTAAGQTCVDPTPTPAQQGDWTCNCPAPQTGSAVAAVAMCVQDECTTSAAMCTAVGQTCNDPNTATTSLNDWTCTCPPPQTGTAVSAQATCTLDECTATCPTCADSGSGNICTGAGQRCTDPNTSPTSTGDWLCSCASPQTGTQNGAVATCVLDECTANGGMLVGSWVANSATCTNAGQACVDPNTSTASTGDWECRCISPQSGSAVATPASCIVDECAVGGAGAGVCAAAGQTCNDPNTSPTSTGDWTCSCPPPQTGTQVAGQATCSLGECTLHSMICTAANQTCVDPNPSPASTNDWRCVCMVPQTGFAVGGPATCVLNECTANGAVLSGSWVANDATCTKAGQTCVDPDTSPTSTDDWMCVCVTPQTGNATAAAATCTLDECTSHASSCSAAGQVCHDPNTSPSSLWDWTCNCTAPSVGQGVAAVAVCVLDECTLHGSVCVSVGQACNDTNPSPGSLNDWRCICPSPQTGSATASQAVCTLDECAVPGANVIHACTAANQLCTDRNHSLSSINDWTCTCLPPLQGSAVGGVATCTLDECVTHGHICTTSGQLCVDPDPTPGGTNNWQCTCPAHLTGTPNVTAPTTCVYDECRFNGTVCTAAGQTCNDPNTTFASQGDWRCLCAAPSVGSALRGVATCTLDECRANGAVGTWIPNEAVCTQANQICVDPDTTPSALGDWRCECVMPLKGNATAARAVCTLDECDINAATCTARGQTCVDPNTNITSTADWVCRCPAPTVGTATAQPATCIRDECLDNWSVCTAAGQTCNDPNQSPLSLGDWGCVCQPPSTGSSVRGAAVCVLDECAAPPGSSGSWIHTCTNAGQRCVDPDTSPTSTGDWTCNCLTPLNGSAVGRVAVCILDECVTQGSICTNTGQTCVDPNTSPTSTLDWTCNCVAPAVGRAVAGVAQCLVNECSVHELVCTSAGQTCVDRNRSPTSLDDWECTCPFPYTGSAPRAPAVCMYDECAAVGANSVHTCVAAGQTCTDPLPLPNSTGDWVCTCAAPLTGNATGRVATCVLDECVVHAAVCSGQQCNDPNTSPSSTWDFTCTCISPQVGVGKGTRATCLLDECLANKGVCDAVGQGCRDPNTAPNSTNDWQCVCPAPSVGVSTAGAASCTLDECRANGAQLVGSWVANEVVCTSAGQVCLDPTSSPNVTGDWMCQCVSPKVGNATTARATCVLDECSVVAINRTCANAGQLCLDPNTSETSVGDWECRCAAPQSGSATRQPAVCVLDECTTQTVCGNQTCHDPNTSPTSTGDWECRCVVPQVGSAVGMPAVCILDECEANGALLAGSWIPNRQTCEKVQQTCLDLDTSPASINDWTCNCQAPLVGRAVGAVAVCTLDECSVHGAVCTAQGQTCFDANNSSSAVAAWDWVCRCVPPLKGEAVASPATCVLNECDEDCPTCAKTPTGNRCSDVGQVCNDTNMSPNSTGDWVCSCPPPSTGQATAAPASCVLDECIAAPGSGPLSGMWVQQCAVAGQSCVDPNPTPASLNDYICTCAPPLTGQAVAQAATCVLDECATHNATCGSAGQRCHDPVTSFGSTGDWYCECASPQVGRQTGGVAVCTLNECVLNATVCIAAGQACHDPNHALNRRGDWQCVCLPPLKGPPATGRPTACSLVTMTRHSVTQSLTLPVTPTDTLSLSATVTETATPTPTPTMSPTTTMKWQAHELLRISLVAPQGTVPSNAPFIVDGSASYDPLGSAGQTFRWSACWNGECPPPGALRSALDAGNLGNGVSVLSIPSLGGGTGPLNVTLHYSDPPTGRAVSQWVVLQAAPRLRNSTVNIKGDNPVHHNPSTPLVLEAFLQHEGVDYTTSSTWVWECDPVDVANPAMRISSSATSHTLGLSELAFPPPPPRGTSRVLCTASGGLHGGAMLSSPPVVILVNSEPDTRGVVFDSPTSALGLDMPVVLTAQKSSIADDVLDGTGLWVQYAYRDGDVDVPLTASWAPLSDAHQQRLVAPIVSNGSAQTIEFVLLTRDGAGGIRRTPGSAVTTPPIPENPAMAAAYGHSLLDRGTLDALVSASHVAGNLGNNTEATALRQRIVDRSAQLASAKGTAAWVGAEEVRDRLSESLLDDWSANYVDGVARVALRSGQVSELVRSAVQLPGIPESQRASLRSALAKADQSYLDLRAAASEHAATNPTVRSALDGRWLNLRPEGIPALTHAATARGEVPEAVRTATTGTSLPEDAKRALLAKLKTYDDTREVLRTTVVQALDSPGLSPAVAPLLSHVIGAVAVSPRGTPLQLSAASQASLVAAAQAIAASWSSPPTANSTTEAARRHLAMRETLRGLGSVLQQLDPAARALAQQWGEAWRTQSNALAAGIPKVAGAAQEISDSGLSVSVTRVDPATGIPNPIVSSHAAVNVVGAATTWMGGSTASDGIATPLVAGALSFPGRVAASGLPLADVAISSVPRNPYPWSPTAMLQVGKVVDVSVKRSEAPYTTLSLSGLVPAPTLWIFDSPSEARTCQYWNTTRGLWAVNGVAASPVTMGCTTSHFTAFSFFVPPPPPTAPPTPVPTLPVKPSVVSTTPITKPWDAVRDGLEEWWWIFLVLGVLCLIGLAALAAMKKLGGSPDHTSPPQPHKRSTSYLPDEAADVYSTADDEYKHQPSPVTPAGGWIGRRVHVGPSWKVRPWVESLPSLPEWGDVYEDHTCIDGSVIQQDVTDGTVMVKFDDGATAWYPSASLTPALSPQYPSPRRTTISNPLGTLSPHSTIPYGEGGGVERPPLSTPPNPYETTHLSPGSQWIEADWRDGAHG